MSLPQGSEAQTAGEFAVNLIRFVRVLRGAGLPLGVDKAIDAIGAVRAVGLARRADFHATLKAVLVSRHEQIPIFDQAFLLFWRNPQQGTQQLQSLLRQLGSGVRQPPGDKRPVSARLAQAMWPGQGASTRDNADLPLELDASNTMSARERLQQRDFADMTQEEMQQGKQLISAMRLALPALPTRRYQPRHAGRQVDLRQSLRQTQRTGSDAALCFRALRKREPTVVVLCDISGSMENYTRMLLHFMHAVSNDRKRIHSFLFGTRLTNITRSLRDRDVDVALSRIGRDVQDWSGGTRIAACLHAFNQRWGRRVLGQGAIVLLITDGLDSDGAPELEQEMRRLARSCLELVWLNPLLRYAGFEAKPAGIRAMLPYVDRFLPVHNLDSLTALARTLEQGRPDRPAKPAVAAKPSGRGFLPS